MTRAREGIGCLSGVVLAAALVNGLATEAQNAREAHAKLESEFPAIVQAAMALPQDKIRVLAGEHFSLRQYSNQIPREYQEAYEAAVICANDGLFVDTDLACADPRMDFKYPGYKVYGAPVSVQIPNIEHFLGHLHNRGTLE